MRVNDPSWSRMKQFRVKRFARYRESAMKVVLRSLSILVLCSLSAAAQTGSGRFLDKLVVEILEDGRKMKLVSEYRYPDQKNQLWIVPAGAVVDGASIPRALWSIVGSPMTGKYRAASVVHDYFCDTKSQNWSVVHRVFYEAMLVSGVEKVQAAYMYWAVYRFGPRWDMSGDELCNLIGSPKGQLFEMQPGRGGPLLRPEQYHYDVFISDEPTEQELTAVHRQFELSQDLESDLAKAIQEATKLRVLSLALNPVTAQKLIDSPPRVLSAEEMREVRRRRSERYR